MNHALCIVHYALCIMNYASCIMHYASCIVHYELINLSNRDLRGSEAIFLK